MPLPRGIVSLSRSAPRYCSSTVPTLLGNCSWFVITLLLTVLTPQPCNAIFCGDCNPSACPSTENCAAAGLTTDACACCSVCARNVNETCGGQHGLLGACGPDLECFIKPSIGQAITGHEEGVCKESQKSRCADAKCASTTITQCPPDSMLIRNMSGINESSCCKPGLTCECRPCVTRSCETGSLPMMIKDGLQKPGSCCDVYDCKRSERCQTVICPEEFEITCPEHSVLKPSLLSEDVCCYLQQGCECKDSAECPSVECPEGLQIEGIAKATNTHGFCCDRFECVNVSAIQTCQYDDHDYSDGDTWSLKKCTTCECRNGVTFCNAEICNNPLCGWMVVPDGECCPVCKGCVSNSGHLYNNSDVWKEDSCVTCRCDSGKAVCQAEMCSVKCRNPQYLPDHCCPICSESSTVVQPGHCPDISNCSRICPGGLQRDLHGCYVCQCKPEGCDLHCLHGYVYNDQNAPLCICAEAPFKCPSMTSCTKDCTYGFRKSRNGCYKCRCSKCPPLNCTKRCLYGYVLNDQSCQICKCQEVAISVTTTSIPAPRATSPSPVGLAGHACLTDTGQRYDDGESWHDGCRRCYCHDGGEMCSLITCPPPKCMNPIFNVGDCCPTCPDSHYALVPFKSQETCHLWSGHHYVEGETWSKDSCTHCICHGGRVLCQSPTCPPLLCHHPVRRPNTCCPVCPDGEDLPRPRKLVPRACRSATGAMYKHGTVWRPSPCQSCTCRYGTIHCFSQMCAPLMCNTTLLQKGNCCPVCINTVAMTSCEQNNIMYSSGEQWQDDSCSTCTCKLGHVSCMRTHCPILPCSIMVRLPQECCPVCLNETKFTISWGGIETLVSVSEASPTQQNVAASGQQEKEPANYLVAIAALGAVLSVVLIIVVILIIFIMRRKRSGIFKTSADHNMLTDYKKRPKSTNLDLQGAMPFLFDVTSNSPVKLYNCTKLDDDLTCPSKDNVADVSKLLIACTNDNCAGDSWNKISRKDLANFPETVCITNKPLCQI